MKKKQTSQKKEIIWNVVNSLLAGGLVFLGACSTGKIDSASIFIAITAAGIVALTQFKNYWSSEQAEYSCKPKIFNFINL